MSNAAKNFDILAASLSILHTNILREFNKINFLYSTKILDFSAKSISPCTLNLCVSIFLYLTIIKGLCMLYQIHLLHERRYSIKIVTYYIHVA